MHSCDYVQKCVALNKVCFCGSLIETASIQDCTESVLEYNKNEESSHGLIKTLAQNLEEPT
jgi:hypothetical protein